MRERIPNELCRMAIIREFPRGVRVNHTYDTLTEAPASVAQRIRRGRTAMMTGSQLGFKPGHEYRVQC
jgi:hypothetical protein